MSRPDDIPEDVWDHALSLWRDDELDDGQTIIARAIMAERRERGDENGTGARVATVGEIVGIEFVVDEILLTIRVEGGRWGREAVSIVRERQTDD